MGSLRRRLGAVMDPAERWRRVCACREAGRPPEPDDAVWLADAALAAIAEGRKLRAALGLSWHTGSGCAPRAEREAIVRKWMQNRVTSYPADQTPPTMADDVRAAKVELPGFPEQMIEDARWPGWKRSPGRPRKIRQE